MTRAALVAFAALLGGCTIIVGGGGPEGVPCEFIDDRDPCGAGNICLDGICQRRICLPVERPCNGLDEDCDGLIDEGAELCNGVDDDCDDIVDEGLDRDGDGFTWCDTGPPPLDCDDGNPDIRPAGPDQPPPADVCDGADNDCDPATLDGAACGPGQVCAPSRGCVPFDCEFRPEICAGETYCDLRQSPPACVARPDGDCVTAGCADAGHVCNPRTGSCAAPLDVGAPCVDDVDCGGSGLCFPAAALRLDRSDLGGLRGLCATTCCDDRDCEPDAACWASGSGARGCVPRAVLAEGTFGAPAGALCAGRMDCAEGERCGSSLDDAYDLPERVSLMCTTGEADDRCDTGGCNDRGFCADDGTCRLQPCDGPADCGTGLCVFGTCRGACRTSVECPGGDMAEPGRCGFVNQPNADRDHWLAACVYDDPGPRPEGGSCQSAASCRDALCLDDEGLPVAGGAFGRCAGVCCSASDCEDGRSCRPVFVEARWQQRCLP